MVYSLPDTWQGMLTFSFCVRTGLCVWLGSLGLVLRQRDMTETASRTSGCGGRHDTQMWNEREGNKSFVDDLMFCRGDVSVRAAITLRDIESYPCLT